MPRWVFPKGKDIFAKLMRQLYSHILSLIFIAFLVSISVNYSAFLKIVNAGASTEEVTNIPEENEEESADEDLQHQFKLLQFSWSLHDKHFKDYPQEFQHFAIQDYVPEVPYSPPELV